MVLLGASSALPPVAGALWRIDPSATTASDWDETKQLDQVARYRPLRAVHRRPRVVPPKSDPRQERAVRQSGAARSASGWSTTRSAARGALQLLRPGVRGRTRALAPHGRGGRARTIRDGQAGWAVVLALPPRGRSSRSGRSSTGSRTANSSSTGERRRRPAWKVRRGQEGRRLRVPRGGRDRPAAGRIQGDVPVSAFEAWYPSGQRRHVKETKDGVVHGAETFWFESGQVRASRT